MIDVIEEREIDDEPKALAKRSREPKPGILKRFGRTFEADARKAISENPDYFVRWYTAKSIALVGAIATAAYYAGKANGISLERGRK